MKRSVFYFVGFLLFGAIALNGWRIGQIDVKITGAMVIAFVFLSASSILRALDQ